MTAETILTAILSAIGSGGAVAFLARAWIEHSFKAEMTKLEAQYRMLGHEHQIRFTRFDERMASAIEGAYGILCEYADVVQGGGEVASPEDFDELSDKFAAFMLRQSIYLPADVVAKLTSTRLALRDELVKDLSSLREASDETSVLAGTYRRHSRKDHCDQLMAELQALLRGHLSRFSVAL